MKPTIITRKKILKADGSVMKQGAVRPKGQVRMIETFNSSSYSVYNMRDLGGWKAAGGKRRLDLAKFGAKIAAVTLEPEGEEEDRELKAAKGKYVFPSCDGKLRIAYKLGGDAQLEFVIYLEK